MELISVFGVQIIFFTVPAINFLFYVNDFFRFCQNLSFFGSFETEFNYSNLQNTI